MANFEFIEYENQDHIATLTMNRPKALNAYHNAMLQEMRQIWRDAKNDPDVWVILLRGEGRGFCAGHDLTLPAEVFLEPPGLHYGDLDVFKPIIAGIHGATLGGGASLAMACDIRIAADDLVFGYPQVKMGVMSVGGHGWLPRSTHRGLAIEMLLTGDTIGAQRALELGLVNRVVPRAELDNALMELAQKIRKNAPLAVAATKEAISGASRTSFRDGIALARVISERLRSSDDAKEGLKSFQEKRKPVFKGR